MIRGFVAFALAFLVTLFAFWQVDQHVQMNKLVEGVLGSGPINRIPMAARM